ncbi:MAG: InlB B-repeat-containing protein [Ruminococcus sp.]
MKNTFRLSRGLFHTKVFLSIVLVVAMITSSLPITFAVTTYTGVLKNAGFDSGADSWSKANGEITVNLEEGVESVNALELTTDENAVYQAVSKEDGSEYAKGTTFKWNLKYKSSNSSDIGALVLGTNTPTATEAQKDQLRQMMTWLRDNRKIDTKVPYNGKYTVVVYSRPFDEDGKFVVEEKDTYEYNFSLVPKVYCTEKFSVTLFRTTETDWITVDNSDNTTFTFNQNFPSIYYSLISYSGSPLVDDVDLTINDDDTGNDECNNLQNGSFEEPAFTEQYKQYASIPYWKTTSTLTSRRFELFRSNTSYHFPSKTNQKVAELDQAAELNAEEASTMYQYINTEAGSRYKWSLAHRGRNGADIMALIIGPNQDVDPSKPGDRLTEDQFMQMVSWVKLHKDEYPDEKEKIEKIEEIQSLNDIKNNDESCDPAKVTVYSKPFAENGGFVEGTATNFSATESTVFSEKWDVTIICSGNQSWKKYGENEEDYSFYNVPEGQDKSIFAFTAYKASNTKDPEDSNKINTYGNLLDGVNFELYYPARSISYTGGVADLTYVYKGELVQTHLGSGESTEALWIDENSTFTLDVTPKYSVTTTTDEEGNVTETIRTDANGNQIQNAFLGAYITIDGERRYYAATAIGDDNAVYFSETVDEETGLITYSYGQSNVSGRVVVELVYSEVYTITYNSKGGKAYSVHEGELTSGAMDWSGSNANVARFYETKSAEYTSTACQWWESNPNVIFKGWELVGGTITKADGTEVSDDEKVLFAEDATVSYTVPEELEGKNQEDLTEEQLNQLLRLDFVISDGNYIGKVNAYSGGVLVANWEYETSVVAQTEQLDGSFKDSDVGGQVSLIDNTTAITDSEGTVYSPGDVIDNCAEFTYTSPFNNVITVSNQENTGYTFLGWYDEEGNKISSTTDHSYTIEPYYSTSDKTTETQTPAVIYARFGLSCKVKFHINDMDTVSTVGNPDADLCRVYYPSSVDVSGASTSYKILNLNSNNRISYFYDIPTPVSTNGKIFKGWYLDPDNNSDNNPIKWDSDTYTTDVDIYAHWIDVGTVNKDADDQKIIDKSTVASGLLPGIDLLGVQIRYEDEDENYPNGRGSGSGQALHFDTDGLRFITCIKEDVLSQTNSLFKTAYGSYSKKSLSYGYVLAKESSAKKALSDGECLEYKDTNVNGVDTTADYNFVTNVDCTSSVGGYNTSTTILDHKNYDEYRIYSLVVTYNTAGKTDAQIESAKNQNVVARPYLRYQDANGLYRTYYQDYTGTNVYGGCSTNYKATWDYLSGKGYFPER